MSISKEKASYWANMAAENDVTVAPDTFSREPRIPLYNLPKHSVFGTGERNRRSTWSYSRFVSSMCLFLALLYFSYNGVDLGRLVRRREFNQQVAVRAPGDGVLEVFQVYAPVAIDGDECTLLLMEHSFGLSYGKPFVGMYCWPMI